MSTHPWCGVLAALSLLPVAAPRAEPAAVVPLPVQDRLAIEQSLGRGILGKPVAAPVIDDPARYLALVPGAWTYRLLKGPDAKHLERNLWTATDQHRGHWRHEVGDSEIAFLERQADGGYVITGLKDLKNAALTRYAPAEPFLLKGLAPQQERHFRMEVRVYDPDDPHELEHEGALAVSYRYLGAYRLDTPIGAHDAVLFKSTYSGQVGPAALNDVQYRFFVRDLGLVAMIERRQVSAFLVYNLGLEVAKLLVDRPQ